MKPNLARALFLTQKDEIDMNTASSSSDENDGYSTDTCGDEDGEHKYDGDQEKKAYELEKKKKKKATREAKASARTDRQSTKAVRAEERAKQLHQRKASK